MQIPSIVIDHVYRLRDVCLNQLDQCVKSPVIHNICQGIYGFNEIKAVLSLGLFVIFLWCCVRGRKLKLCSLVWYYWFSLVAVYGIFFDGYFVFFPSSISTGKSFLDVFWKYAGGIESRSATFETTYCLVKYLLFATTVPMAFAVSCAIRRGAFVQFPAIIFTSALLSLGHTILLLGNFAKNFQYTTMSGSLLWGYDKNLITFVGFHGAYILMSMFSILRSFYYCQGPSVSGMACPFSKCTK